MINDWFPIIGDFGGPLKPVNDNPLYKDGVGVGPNMWVSQTHNFPLMKGRDVTLYQDAHLVREPKRELPNGGELSLGELLKYKSEEGVQVVVLVWDDKTSHNKFLLKTVILNYAHILGMCHVVVQDGMMQTHDEETKNFFRHSSVRCVLAPHYVSTKLSIFKKRVMGNLYMHHQKYMVLDTQALGNNRKIMTFIGGHRLCSDLDTFKNDTHNPTFASTINVPRQPWHDLHRKVEGQAAYDILKNFEQRWKKAAKLREFNLKDVRRWHMNALLRLDEISWILCPSTSPDSDKKVQVRDKDDLENWDVQVFRSIDSGSVKGFIKSIEEAAKQPTMLMLSLSISSWFQNLICGKNLKVDERIHMAYMKAIRSVQHFIYIENQYFLGCSYHWPSYKNAGANNLVTMELALKITSKISANAHFCVYIVIPLWPEGVPTSAAGQTMTMMYKIIAQALEKAGLSHKYHPSDYLNFYCLGKREPLSCSQSSSQAMNQQSENNALGSVQKFRRFVIYVHAKGMIVDDEYVIMGSANINQRSLDGSRDTEIAMGAYQPHHNWTGKKRLPHGQVYGYRMSLWAEHLGDLKDSFREPQSFEFVKRVNKIAKRNWKAYVDEDQLDPKEMRGHLMQCPIHVSRDGKVSPLASFETFLDMGGKILGLPTTLPDALTT
ncbi:hypothetical protein ACJRO7_004090 [Eucalyptus globulus]|uniref:phospholipase D n=1 Tax=Eucalyptus globulus TaxID=34317 RepID=A0ABD3IVW6_EUCGL